MATDPLIAVLHVTQNHSQATEYLHVRFFRVLFALTIFLTIRKCTPCRATTEHRFDFH